VKPTAIASDVPDAAMDENRGRFRSPKRQRPTKSMSSAAMRGRPRSARSRRCNLPSFGSAWKSQPIA